MLRANFVIDSGTTAAAAQCELGRHYGGKKSQPLPRERIFTEKNKEKKFRKIPSSFISIEFFYSCNFVSRKVYGPFP